MIVEYERTIEDFVEFNLFHLSHSPSARRQILITQAIVALLVFTTSLLILYSLNQQTRGWTYLDYIVALVATLISVSIIPYYNRIEIVRGVRQASREGDNNAILGHQTISLSPENIFIKTQGGESKIAWSAINKIAQNEKYIFLYISSMNAIVIPIKAFSTDKLLKEFLDYVNVYREQKNKNVKDSQ